MLCELLLVAVVVWVVQRRWLMRKQRALANQLRTNLRSWPIVGHTYMFLGSDEDKMEAFKNIGRDSIQVGGVSRFMLFDQLFICVTDPVVAEIVLRECLEKHDLMKTVFNFVMGNSSFIAPVPIWRARRRVMIPTFNSRNLVQFVDIFSKHSTIMADLLEKEAGKGAFSFWKFVSTYVLNTASETTMGITMEAGNEEFLTALERLLEFGTYVIFRPWFQTEFTLQFVPSFIKLYKLRRIIRDYITKIISEKQKRINMRANQAAVKDTNGCFKALSFLDRLLEVPEGQQYTGQELLAECTTLLVAGFDTTSTCAAWTALMLSRHPDVQHNVYEELQEVLGDSDRPVSHDDLPRLKYLEAVIKETLRLYSVAPIIIRRADKDVEIPSGLTIVKGCGVLINIWALNRNPEYWGADADQFRPERFFDVTPRHPAAFMSFGFRPRNCVGYRYAMMSLKTVLATLLRRYRVLAPHGVPQGDTPRSKFNMILKHVDNYMIRLERRHARI